MSDSKAGPFTARQQLLLCRQRIDKSPGLLATLEVCLGSVAFAHLLTSLAMLWSSPLREAVLPLAVLCLEVTVLSLAVLVLVIRDVCARPEESLSVWQREALGRLLRNIVIWSLLGVSLLWGYEQAQGQDKLALTGAVVPALVAACLGGVKIVLVRTDRTWFWLGLSVLFGLQMLLLVLKVDFGVSISWLSTCFPIYIISIDALFLTFTVSFEDLSQAKSPLLPTIICGILKSAACLMVLITTLLCALQGDSAGPDQATLSLLEAATFCLCYVSAVRLSGNYLLNIVWGHAEMDFLQQKYPALLARRQTV